MSLYCCRLFLASASLGEHCATAVHTCVLLTQNSSRRTHVDKMTASTASLSGSVVVLAVWTLTAFHFMFLVAADASKEVQQLRSSIEKLHALKQLLNAEQVRLFLPLGYLYPFYTDNLLIKASSESTCACNSKNKHCRYTLI